MFKALISAAVLSAFALAAPASAQTKLTVGASYVPHAEILEQAKPILAKEGIDLVIVPFQDYILPNTALAAGEIDANYFQHTPYLNSVLEDHKNDPTYDFVSVGGIHIEPIGIYSKRVKSLKDLPQNGEVILRDAVAEEGRILSIFQREGVIKLKDGVTPLTARITDIVDNPKNLKFKPDVEASLLPKVYASDEADAVIINANYALDAKLDPVKDPIAVESGENNPYANLIVVRKANAEKPEIKKLVEVLQSKPIHDFIIEKYKGAVLPVSK